MTRFEEWPTPRAQMGAVSAPSPPQVSPVTTCTKTRIVETIEKPPGLHLPIDTIHTAQDKQVIAEQTYQVTCTERRSHNGTVVPTTSAR